MDDIVIKVEHLSKMYKIGALHERHDMLRDLLMHGFASFFSRNGTSRALDAVPSGSDSQAASTKDSKSDHIWALNDVSLDIHHGEVVGFIGRNGAGKSTLLKILSRITEPTKGRVQIQGRIGTLLEVGAGFHSELTGRENVYLSGAVLGMAKREIDRKFDEIVAFSGVEKFMDTPVKRFSSGMYVRLAFSVAAHLDPDILIVDEVLAVGDQAFRFKCLDKMEQIRKEGRTILFVSHNVDALSRMCERVFMLEAGKIVKSGSPHEVLPQYLATAHSISAAQTWADLDTAPGDNVIRLRNVRVRDENGTTVGTQDIRSPVGIEAEYDVLQPGHVIVPNYHFFNDEGLLMFVVLDVFSEWKRAPRPLGRYTSTAWLPGNFLAEGRVTVDIAVSSLVPSTQIHVMKRHAVGFQVIDSHEGDSARGDFRGQLPGVVRPLVKWTTILNDSCDSKNSTS
jgi:homopolymeric O-antigen transport system ATP-binding protein